MQNYWRAVEEEQTERWNRKREWDDISKEKNSEHRMKDRREHMEGKMDVQESVIGTELVLPLLFLCARNSSVCACIFCMFQSQVLV